jgi:enoyl-CoA hydratase/carnithine racemase
MAACRFEEAQRRDVVTAAKVITSVENGVQVIVLNRPGKLNAWTYRMHGELHRAVVAANADPEVEAIVLTATGKAFCAGADVNAVFGMSEDEKARARADSHVSEWVALLRQSKPIVAAVNGAAIGIGVTLTLAVDQILAAPEAYFALSFVRMGLVPELAASALVQQRVGFGAASRVLLTGETLSAQDALAMSLIDGIAPADELLARAKALALRMGRNPQQAILATKKLLTDNGNERDLTVVQQREAAALAICYESPEHKEAIAAFKGKRQPDFKAVRR